MLFQSIQSVLVIILIIALGYVLQQRRWFGEEFPKNISRLITDIALPASIFSSVLKYLSRSELLSLGSSLIYPMGGVAIAYIVAIVLAKVLKVRPGRRGTFINTIANANTIFIGLPLNIALFGENSMPYFLVYYVTNTVSTWVVGIFFIKADDPTKTSNSKTQHLNIKQILPAPLIGFFVAILFLIVGIPIPSFIDQTFTYVGNIVTPLALLYIGIMLFNSKLSSIRFDRDTIVALLGRFILSPVRRAFRAWAQLRFERDIDCPVGNSGLGHPSGLGSLFTWRHSIRHQCCYNEHTVVCIHHSHYHVYHALHHTLGKGVLWGSEILRFHKRSKRPLPLAPWIVPLRRKERNPPCPPPTAIPSPRRLVRRECPRAPMAHHSQPLPHLALGGHTAQTRVNQGLDYFLRFVEAFPSVTDLAQASEDQVLSLWQGLGYYSRAHNLHRAAHKL